MLKAVVDVGTCCRGWVNELPARQGGQVLAGVRAQQLGHQRFDGGLRELQSDYRRGLDGRADVTGKLVQSSFEQGMDRGWYPNFELVVGAHPPAVFLMQ